MKKTHNKIFLCLYIILIVLLIFKIYNTYSRKDYSKETFGVCPCANVCALPCEVLWEAGIMECPPTEVPPCPGGIWPLFYDL